MGVKDLLGGENNKQKGYNNNYKKNNMEKSNSHQGGQRNYKNNNQNYNNNKYQQNNQMNQNTQNPRDTKPTFYNNSKKDTPLIQTATIINNNNSYSNNSDTVQKPLFKEREGHFVEIKNQDAIKQPVVAPTSNAIQPPVFYGSINKEAIIIEDKKVEPKKVEVKKKEEFVKKEDPLEDLVIPVFVNTKKVEGSNISLEKDVRFKI
jgi:hypothetical protein